MEPVVKYVNEEGLVGVLYSPGFGAGWSTWNSEYVPQMIFDGKIVKMLLDADLDDQWYWKIESYCKKTYPDAYTGGLEDLTVAWVEPGTEFIIAEYDGSESVECKETDFNWQKT